MNKIEIIEKYIHDFFSTRYCEYVDFFQMEYNNRREGIYKYKNGSDLMDFLSQIVRGDIGNKIYIENLIPQIHSTPNAFI